MFPTPDERGFLHENPSHWACPEALSIDLQGHARHETLLRLLALHKQSATNQMITFRNRLDTFSTGVQSLRTLL